MTRLFWSRGSHTSSQRSGTRQTPERQKLLIDSFSLNRCGARRRYKATRLNEWHLSKYCTLQRRNAHSILYYSFFVCVCLCTCVRARAHHEERRTGRCGTSSTVAGDNTDGRSLLRPTTQVVVDCCCCGGGRNQQHFIRPDAAE